MLRKPQLFLHVGTHKTGTTSFQALLSSNRERLRDRGILYPDPSVHFGGSSKVHHAVAHAFTETKKMEIAAVRTFLEQVHKEAVETGASVVISTESLYGHIHGRRSWASGFEVNRYWKARQRYLRAAADYLSNFEVTVQIAIRRPDRYIESYYGERVVKSLPTSSFARWRDRFGMLCDYSTQIGLLRSAFSDVRIHRYEDAAAGIENELVRDYGLQDGFLGSSVRSRASADARLLLWFRVARPGIWQERRDFVASPEAHNSVPQYGKSTLWEGTRAQREYNRQFVGTYGRRFFGRRIRRDRFPALLDDVSATEIARAWAEWRDAYAAQSSAVDVR